MRIKKAHRSGPFLNTLADQYITICHETYSAAEHCIIKIIGPDCKVISTLKEVDYVQFQLGIRSTSIYSTLGMHQNLMSLIKEKIANLVIPA